MASYSNTSLKVRPHYVLKIWVPPELPEVKEFYVEARNKHNIVVSPVIFSGSKQTFDAGFDLICPRMVSAKAQETTKIDHEIQCSMSKNNGTSWDNSESIQEFGEYPVGYYLYPRSSTGTKTPLRLANSVGIIDSGYRGNIIAAVDNWMMNDYVVDKGHRIVQLCPPDLSYPVLVEIVDKFEELGKTERGEGGFGSTGS
tara:strand:- start:300 stop:896 length:597 start_codon:yes stop_codon:yes gene_type:complete